MLKLSITKTNSVLARLNESLVKLEKQPRVVYITLAAITIIGAGARWLNWRNDQLIGRDALFYLEKVQYWLNNDFSAVKFYDSGVLLLFGIKIFYNLGMTPEHAGVLFSMLTGTLLIPAIYLLGTELFQSRYAGLCAAFLLAGTPLLIDLSFQIQRESSYLLFWVLALYCALRGLKGRWLMLLSAGGCLSLCALSRYEGIELVILLPLAMMFMTPRDKILQTIPLKTLLIYLGALLCLAVSFMVMGIPVSYFLNGLSVRFSYHLKL